MKKPKRIQRKRTKGWKMPKNTVYVGRPSKWGNPFKVKMDEGNKPKNKMLPVLAALWTYKNHLGKLMKAGKIDITELKGKNLACWCKPGEPCHADILLKLANQ